MKCAGLSLGPGLPGWAPVAHWGAQSWGMVEIYCLPVNPTFSCTSNRRMYFQLYNLGRLHCFVYYLLTGFSFSKPEMFGYLFYEEESIVLHCCQPLLI